jgi:hypothetical protein
MASEPGAFNPETCYRVVLTDGVHHLIRGHGWSEEIYLGSRRFIFKRDIGDGARKIIGAILADYVVMIIEDGSWQRAKRGVQKVESFE